MRDLSLLRLVLAAALAVTFTPGIAKSQAPPSAKPSEFKLQLTFKERTPVSVELVQNLVLFKARIEGREVWALLDNGTQRTTVDLDFAKQIGLNLSSRAGQLHTATGSLETWLVPYANVDIPGQLSFGAPIAAADLSVVSKHLGRPISLIVGNELFRGLAVAIRPTSKTLEFWPSMALNLPPAAPRLALPEDRPHLVLKSHVPQLEVLISGKPVSVALDLGDNGMLSLTDAAWERLGLDSLPTTTIQSVGFDGRVVSAKQAIVDEVSLGAVKATSVSVSSKPLLRSDGEGRIGLGLMSRFDFAVDLKAARIWLLSPAR